ncbi:EF-hand calcium-binding domain-containing protein 11 isoform X4 [Trachemys scripta elegans]|uniref:EF-hand calcium-binding domain-containing protein 11 isoform X4 n=1 Tax=Trachemys scripta elegans TaxID=31138 RepID=UPI0015554204|nr:EF-hand calcium-binding domain-containing protein 11 isoform X4 [Trachemys scripta elegans]
MCAAPSRAGSGRSSGERYVRVFEACDEDKKGYLSREDFKVAVVMLFGYKPSKVEVDSVMASVQQKNSDRGFLTLEDFKRAFNSIAPKLPERIIVEAFRFVQPWVKTLAGANIPLSKTDHPLVREFLDSRVRNGGTNLSRTQLTETYLPEVYRKEKEN